MKSKPLTPAQRSVLGAMRVLSAKRRFGRRVPTHAIDGAYDGRTVRSLVLRGLLVVKSTGKIAWYERRGF